MAGAKYFRDGKLNLRNANEMLRETKCTPLPRCSKKISRGDDLGEQYLQPTGLYLYVLLDLKINNKKFTIFSTFFSSIPVPSLILKYGSNHYHQVKSISISKFFTIFVLYLTANLILIFAIHHRSIDYSEKIFNSACSQIKYRYDNNKITTFKIFIDKVFKYCRLHSSELIMNHKFF